MQPASGPNRRRHFRLDCNWGVTITGVELDGTTRRFDATVRNVSMSGLFIEAAIAANLWAEKPVAIELPGGVGAVDTLVRRFLEYGSDGSGTTRWGVEFVGLTVAQSAHLARLMFTEARHARAAENAADCGRDPQPAPRSALHAAIAARPTTGPIADR